MPPSPIAIASKLRRFYHFVVYILCLQLATTAYFGRRGPGSGMLSTMLRHAGALYQTPISKGRCLPSHIYGNIYNASSRISKSLNFSGGYKKPHWQGTYNKFGALKASIATVMEGRSKDMFAPVSGRLERTWEAALPEEMLGKRKPGETLPNLIKSIPTFLRSNYGILSIQFGEPAL